MNVAQPLFWPRLWAHNRLHVMMLALTAVLVGAMIMVLQGWANPFWLDCAVSLVSAFLCWRAGKGRRLAFGQPPCSAGPSWWNRCLLYGSGTSSSTHSCCSMGY